MAKKPDHGAQLALFMSWTILYKAGLRIGLFGPFGIGLYHHQR